MLNNTDVTYVELADVRTCRLCGRDYLHVPMDVRDDPFGYLALEPFAVPASQLVWGWRLADARRWVIHHAVLGKGTGFAFPDHRCVSAQRPPLEGRRMTQPDSIFDVPEKRPSVSFKDAPVGATVTMTVDGPPAKVQARTMDGKLDYWDDGNPKWNAVLNVTLNGAPYSLWAPITRKPGSLFMALAEAKQTAGAADYAAGGTLTVRVSGYEPPENPGLSPRRLYQAKYDAPSVWDGGASNDPWAATPSPQAQPPSPAPASPPVTATGPWVPTTATPAIAASPPAAAPAAAQPPWEMT